jgi:hypothetical protein
MGCCSSEWQGQLWECLFNAAYGVFAQRAWLHMGSALVPFWVLWGEQATAYPERL